MRGDARESGGKEVGTEEGCERVGRDVQLNG